ncbi:MAG: hypothetical protein PHI55_00050 [Burkholderiaceae bacterium]|nr:hypothetical protein [Burkholderiaceae bacterium]
MAVNLDPPRGTPLPLLLAEAALQRQNSLLGSDGAGAPRAQGAAPAASASPVNAGSAQAPAPAAVPLPVDRVSLSPQAQQWMGAAANTAEAPSSPALRQAEAATERQNSLLAAGPAPGGLPGGAPSPPLNSVPGSAPGPAPMAAPGGGPGPATPPAPGVAASPAPGAPAAAAPPAGAPAPGGAGPRNPFPASLPLPVGAGTERAQTAPALWPAGGVAAPWRPVLAALVQQLTAPVLPLRVVSAQPWPLALVQSLLDAPLAQAVPGQPLAASPLPVLQTWLVRQGEVQTPEGPRSFALSLRVPAQWLQTLPPQTEAHERPPGPSLGGALAVPPGPAASPLQAAFEGRPQTLSSGAFALVLQSPASAATRTSALLQLDFQPLPPAAMPGAVYGRELLQNRADPWLQMALLQNSAQVQQEEDSARRQREALCDTPGCPYVGRASCVQPFCVALHPVQPVAALPPGAGPLPGAQG